MGLIDTYVPAIYSASFKAFDSFCKFYFQPGIFRIELFSTNVGVGRFWAPNPCLILISPCLGYLFTCLSNI